MKSVKSFLKAALILVILAAILTFVVHYYSWIFSKRVSGQVINVERVNLPTAILGNRATDAQLYSYSVLIQGEDGTMYTASSEDRQWAVVKKGYCVDALLYRYAPWQIEQGNTFFNARVEKVRVCPGQTALPDAPAEAPAQIQTTPPPPPPNHQ